MQGSTGSVGDGRRLLPSAEHSGGDAQRGRSTGVAGPVLAVGDRLVIAPSWVATVE